MDGELCEYGIWVFRLAAKPQKSQTITLPTITRLKLLRLRVILEFSLSSKPSLLAKRTTALAGDKNVVEGSQS